MRLVPPILPRLVLPPPPPAADPVASSLVVLHLHARNTDAETRACRIPVFVFSNTILYYTRLYYTRFYSAKLYYTIPYTKRILIFTWPLGPLTKQLTSAKAMGMKDTRPGETLGLDHRLLSGMVGYVMVWYMIVWCIIVWYVMKWYMIVWYSMIGYDKMV